MESCCFRESPLFSDWRAAIDCDRRCMRAPLSARASCMAATKRACSAPVQSPALLMCSCRGSHPSGAESSAMMP